MLEGFTGYLLPWDQTAYWATVVGINLNGTAPFLGPLIAQFLRGGARDRRRHAHRFYSMHMLLIPGAIFGAHRAAPVSRRSGSASRRRRGRRRPRRGARRRAEQPARRAARGRRRRGPERARRRDAAWQAVELERAPRAVRALQEGRQEARQAVLPVRDVPRHGDEPRRRLGDHRARDDLEVDVVRAAPRRTASGHRSARSTPSRPTRARRASCRGRTGTSTSSSICSGSSSGRSRSSSARSACRRSR